MVSIAQLEPKKHYPDPFLSKAKFSSTRSMKWKKTQAFFKSWLVNLPPPNVPPPEIRAY